MKLQCLPHFKTLCAWVCCAFVLPFSSLIAEITPLPNAHAHNDYEHTRPLLDALSFGFCSVEADIYVVDDALLVAHDREDLTPERNLKDMYLTPLLNESKKNNGTIYPKGPSFYLMIDFKSEAEPTYAALRKLLYSFREMLTEYGSEGVKHRAVTVVISGNRPTQTLGREKLRYAFIDGRLADLEANESPAFLIPWISENWNNHFDWNGRGEISEMEQAKLEKWIEQAHAQGRKVRFWASPETGNYWKTAHHVGVDFINTDKLERLQQILLGLQSNP